MNTLRTLTIIFNLVIIIPIGHGIVPLVFFEIPIVSDVFSGNLDFSMSGSFYDRLMIAGLVSFIGKLILLSSFFFAKKIRSTLTIIGCVTLLTATYILIKDSITGNFDMFPLTISLPLIVTALVLLVAEIRDLRKKVKVDQK